MSRAPLVAAAALFAAGILAGLERPVPIGGGPLAFFLAAAGIALSLGAMAVRRWPAALVLGALAAVGVGMGSAAAAGARATCGARLPSEAGVSVRGVVESRTGPKLRLRLEAVRVGAAAPRGWLACDEVVAARWDGAAAAPGSALLGSGRWWRPGVGGTGGSPGVLMLDSVAPAPERAGTGSVLAAARGAAARRLERQYGERAGLANSLLLAQRDGLDRDVRDRFVRAGLSHLLAISGLHVGLVAGVLLLLGRIARVPGRWPAGLAAGGAVAYVLFLGAPTAALRAALQTVLVLLGAGLQRPARAEALMAAAALALLALDPGALVEPGFQLSFAGVAGLLALRRPLLRAFGGLAGLRAGPVRAGAWLADGLATGLAATLATAPIAAWHFGQVSVIGIAANLAAIPLVGALVPALALSLLAGSVWEPAGLLLAGAGAALLAGLDAVARWAAAVPGGSVRVAPYTALLWTAAALVAWGWTRRIGRVRPWVRGAAAAGAAAALLGLTAVRVGSDRVEIHAIDVGQGDAIAIRSPAGRWLLVDAGLGGAGYDAGARVVVPYLHARGVRRLAGLVLTHPHLDHIGGAAAVIAALRPAWVGDPARSEGTPGYLEVLDAARSAGSRWLALGDGAELELDGVVVEFLHPSPSDSLLETNDISVVLRLEYGAFSALLTGDASAEVEARLVSRWGEALEAELLKVGHHGSRTSTSGSLLGATGARVAMISAGRGNGYGHPHASVLARLDSAGVRVVRTDRDGSIVVRADASGRLEVEVERER